jgi:PAS domain S-box-containing protein
VDAERRLSELFSRLPIAMFQCRASGEIVLANPALATLLGHESADTMRGLFLADICAEPSTAADIRRRFRGDAPPSRMHVELRHTRGESLSAFLGLRAVTDERGRVACYEGTVLDVSNHVALETWFLHEQKQETLGRLVSGIVHDFSNLLTAIRGYAELLLQQAQEPGQREDTMELLKISERAATLTRQLVAFSRRDSVDLKALDVNAVIAETAAMLRRLMGSHITVTLALGEGAPKILADRGQVEQLLVNLAVNARDAMPDGGELTFLTEPMSSHTVRLSVRDTGVGMSEHVRAHLFEPFFTTKTAERGSGLGLSIVDSIVRRLGGTISVTSAQGRGTTFTVDLPGTLTL